MVYKFCRLYSESVAHLGWNIQEVLTEVKASEDRMKVALKESEERLRKEIADRHYKVREELIKSSFRVTRQVLHSTEDVKASGTDDATRIIAETNDTVADAQDNVVARVTNATKVIVKHGVAGTYFSPEVRRKVGVAELRAIAGSRVAEEWRKSSPTESVFYETDKVLKNLDETVKKANSTLMAAENLLGLMRQRTKRICEEAKEFFKKDD